MLPTGIFAGEMRARGAEVDALVPDCAELWSDEVPDVVAVGGEGNRIDFEMRYTRGEWRWLAMRASFTPSASPSQTR